MTPDAGLMEQEIIKEENLNAELSETKIDRQIVSSTSGKKTQRTFQSILNKLISIKKPKLVTLVIFFALILVVYFALVLSSQRQGDIPTVPTAVSLSPSPKVSVKPEIADLTDKINDFNSKLESLEDYQKKLALPSVELDISFEK